MVDAREQIKELLKEIGVTVKPSFPKTINRVPLITFLEISNNNTNVVVRDFIAFQIDSWANSFEEVIDLSMSVDAKMQALCLKQGL